MSWTKGKTLMSGKYRIVRKLGAGGFGETYLAENVALKKQVVIKSPNLDLQNDKDYDSYIKRFQDEGRILGKISHPNVVQVIDIHNEGKIPFLVMEYVDGMTLRTLIRERKPLREPDALVYLKKLSEALQIIHSKNLLHCDIHPENIMFREMDDWLDPVIIDFGSAQFIQSMASMVQPGVCDSFAPPEYSEGKPDVTWDIYGLAASFYFALTGEDPQPGINRRLYGDRLIPLNTYSNNLNKAIISAMDINPNKRTRTMRDFNESLNNSESTQERSKQSIQKFQRQITYWIQDSRQYLRKNNIVIPNIPKVLGIPNWVKSNSDFPWIIVCSLVFGYFPMGIMLGLAREELQIWVLTFVLIGSGAGLSMWISNPNELNYSSSSENQTLGFMIFLGILWAIEGLWVGWKIHVWSWLIPWGLIWGYSLLLLSYNEISFALVWFGIVTTLFIGVIVGQLEGIGEWRGLLCSLSSLAQFISIACIPFISEVVQSAKYKSRNLLICGVAPSVGIIMGGIIGWSIVSFRG